MNTSGYSGAVTKTAEVYTNDPQHPQFTLMMSLVVATNDAPTGKQMGPFVVGPSNQWSARVPRGLSANGLIAVTNTTAQPIRITKAESDEQSFSTALQTLEEGRRYGLSFTSLPALPVGSHRQTVKLLTDSKEMPAVELQLEAVVFPAVQISPANLVFDNVAVSDPEMEISLVSKFLWLRLGRGTGLEVKSITSDLPFIKGKIESVEQNGVAVLLRIGFSEKPPKGTHKGKIRVETNNSDAKELEVTVTVTAN